MQLPIGAEEKFEGVVDLVQDEGDLLGRRHAGHEIRGARTSRPTWLKRRKQWREKMVETAAEASEELMNKYLESGELSGRGHQEGPARCAPYTSEIFPMLCGSAFKNKGVQAMLDAVLDYMPSPIDIARRQGHQRRRRARGARAPRRRRAVLRARVQDHDRPVRRPAHVLPRLLGRGATRATPSTTRSRAARSGWAASCRCTPTSARRSRKCSPATSPRRWA